MEHPQQTSTQLIAEAYERYRSSVFFFLLRRIGCREEAEDLTQDLFLRLMDYRSLLRPETLHSFVYTIARHLLADYWRRHYHQQEYTSYIYDTCSEATDEVQSTIVARDLAARELDVVNRLSERRRQVYALSRFDHLDVADIATRLNLSLRTVENHLYAGRKQVRQSLQLCV